MKFSIILATRNRPALLRVALDSVLDQRDAEVEAIVVDDGSAEAYRADYERIATEFGTRVRFIALSDTQEGHGAAFARNRGAEMATGDYLGFLDDDDCWTDPDHLVRAATVLAAETPLPDLYLTQQRAFRDGIEQAGAVWLEGLEDHLSSPARQGDVAYFRVDVPDLLKAAGFAHLNTTLVRRTLFDRLGGFDESLRYEEDRDFYLRAIDGAKSMIYAPYFTARHNIPAPGGDSASQAISQTVRFTCQERLLDKAARQSEHREIQAYARQHRAFALQKLARAECQAGQKRTASAHARRAFLLRPSPSAFALAVRLSIGL